MSDLGFSVLKKVTSMLLWVSLYCGVAVADGTEASGPTSPALVSEFNVALEKSRVEAASNQFAKAADSAGKALNLATELQVDEAQLATLELNYGYLLRRANRLKKACPMLQSSFDRHESLYGKNSEELLSVADELGYCYASEYDRPLATKYLKLSLRIAKEHFGHDSMEYAEASFRLGQARLMKLRSRDGLRNLEESLKLFAELKGADSMQAVSAAFMLGKYDISIGRPKEAIERFEDILSKISSAERPDTRLELTIHGFLVEAYEMAGQTDLATRHCLAIGRMSPEREVQDYIPLFKPVPKYPASRLKKGDDGWVIVEFAVDESGFVRDPFVVERSGKGFDESSLDVVARFRYAPAFKDGKPVRTEGVRNRIVYEVK